MFSCWNLEIDLIYRPDFGEKLDQIVGPYLVVVEQMLTEILDSIGTVNINFKKYLLSLYIFTRKINCNFYHY